MTFRDVPSLAKFEQFARKNSECPITMETYRRVRELIANVAPPAAVMDPLAGGAPVASLKESCAAIEKSTRVLWACAAATSHINPPMWDYVPDYDSSIEYFSSLDDLELMAVTKVHRIDWDHIFEAQAS
jgi:hypothetical protein